MTAAEPAATATPARSVVRAGVIALFYFAAGRLGLELYIAQGTATLVWAPTGIAIASILLLGGRVALPGVALGALLVTLSLGLPLAAALAITAGNTTEAWLAAWLLQRHTRGARNPFDSVRGTLRYIFMVALLATLASAVTGATATVLAGIRPPEAFGTILLLWWLGDVAGALLVAPVLYLLGRRWLERHRPDRHMLWRMSGRHGEFLLVLLLAVGAAVAVYGNVLPERVSTHLSWSPFLFLLWAASRFSPLATVIVSLAVSVGAIASILVADTLREAAAVNENLVTLYSFLFAQTIATLVASAFIHERRSLMRELVVAREQAQQASEQKSRFLANMSHEIRTPLNGIIGMTSLLAGEIADRGQREKLRIIQSSADSLLNILNDVLDLARIEAGKLAIVPREFDLTGLVRDVTGLFQSQAELKGIVLRARIDGNVPRRAVADDTRLRQVLANVLSNAVKFTERGNVELHVSTPDAGPERVLLQFTVTDTGIGIDRANLAKIFDPFVQADDSASRRAGGSGLGLSISRQLSERMGGTLLLESTPGSGTCVTIRMPVGTAAPVAVETADSSSGRSGNTVIAAGVDDAGKPPRKAGVARILVAEDNDINARVIRQMLERLGHDCVVVENGDEALACWQDGFDLVLLDCQMPVRDGYDTAREIRRRERQQGSERRLPLIALTANVMREERSRCLEAGMDDHLGKPLRLEALAGMLARHLPRRDGDAR